MGGGGGDIKMMSSPFSGSHNVLPLWLRGSTLQTQTHTHAHTDTGDRWTNGEMCAHWRERERERKGKKMPLSVSHWSFAYLLSFQ